MAEVKRSLFGKMKSVDFLSKSRFELPNVNISTQDTGRELTIIGVKQSKTPTKLNNLKSTPKKRFVTNGKTALNENIPISQAYSKLNVFSPKSQKSYMTKRFVLSETNNNNNPDVNCLYEIKENNNDTNDAYCLIKKHSNSSEENIKNTRQKLPKFAVNLNLALNVDHSKQSELSETVSGKNIDENTSNMDTPLAIKVAVRMRPLFENEKDSQESGVDDILIKDNQVLIKHKKECFEFDCCLNSSNPELFNYASQEAVYRKMGEPLLDSAFKGYNTCLFAYGQSGSGKTYTMMGSEVVPGIIPRFLNDLFKRISLSTNIKFNVNISFLEIYNEKIHDLLSDEFSMINKKLKVREHPQTGPYVEDLTVYNVENYEHAMELLKNGISRRATGTTCSNDQSSRSHSIFNIILIQNKTIYNEGNEASEVSSFSKINLVDLAGSERVNSENILRFKESTMINKSLLTLGKVINHLSENNGSCHIPYRESVLTYLLSDSLGGNSQTSMIATVSPAKKHLDETLNTLRYASKAQKIVNIIHVNEDPKVKIINKLLKQISFLKKEVDKNRDDSHEIDSETKSDTAHSIDIDKSFNESFNQLKVKFECLLDNKKKLSEKLSKLKSNYSCDKTTRKNFDFESTIVDELKGMLNDVKKVNILENVIDVDSELKEISDEFMEIAVDFDKRKNLPKEKKEEVSKKDDEPKEYVSSPCKKGNQRKNAKNKINEDFKQVDKKSEKTETNESKCSEVSSKSTNAGKMDDKAIDVGGDKKASEDVEKSKKSCERPFQKVVEPEKNEASKNKPFEVFKKSDTTTLDKSENVKESTSNKKQKGKKNAKIIDKSDDETNEGQENASDEDVYDDANDFSQDKIDKNAFNVDELEKDKFKKKDDDDDNDNGKRGKKGKKGKASKKGKK